MLVTAQSDGKSTRSPVTTWVTVALVAASLVACGGGTTGGSSNQNIPPLANAGPVQRVLAKSVVTLDGSASSDANNDSLTYSWSLTARPSESSATLNNPSSIRATFSPDVPGTYSATLTVNDGKAASSPSTVLITAVPQLAIFFVSGHTDIGDGQPSYSYLNTTAGPNIVTDLREAGYTTEQGYFVDDANDVMGAGGFQSLVATMRAVRDQYVPHGTRVLVIAHSHGGVWAHAAIRQVSDLTITAAVDLDTSSYGWGATGHDTQNSFIGGDPRNRFVINNVTTCPAYSVPSEQTSNYDIEDVVFQNVRFAFEVRSGEMAPAGDEWYDEKWSIREDGNTDNLFCYFSNTSHTEVHQPSGATVPVVKNWLRARLAE